MRLANPIRVGAAASLLSFILFGALALCAISPTRTASPRAIVFLMVASVLLGACVATIQASMLVVDRAAIPGNSDRKSVGVAGLRASLAPSLMLCLGVAALLHWQMGDSFTWSMVWQQTAMGVSGIFMSIIVLVSIRTRQLDKVIVTPLRDTERRTMASFARYAGRTGALTLTDERLTFRGLEGLKQIDVPLASIRSAAVIYIFGFQRGIEVDAMQTRWRFLIPDPERWIDAIGAIAHRAETSM